MVVKQDFDILQDGLVTVAEAATLLRCARQTVYNLLSDGQLRSTRVGRLRRIPKRAVMEYLARGMDGEAPS